MSSRSAGTAAAAAGSTRLKPRVAMRAMVDAEKYMLIEKKKGQGKVGRVVKDGV